MRWGKGGRGRGVFGGFEREGEARRGCSGIMYFRVL